MAPTHSFSSFQTKTRKHDAAGAAGVRWNKRHKSLRLILCAPIPQMDLILTLTERAKKPQNPFSMQAAMFKCCNAPVMSFRLAIDTDKAHKLLAAQTRLILNYSLLISALQKSPRYAPACGDRWVCSS